MNHDTHAFHCTAQSVTRLGWKDGRCIGQAFFGVFLTFGFSFFSFLLFSLLTHSEPVRAQLASSWSVSAQAYIHGFRFVSFHFVVRYWVGKGGLRGHGIHLALTRGFFASWEIRG